MLMDNSIFKGVYFGKTFKGVYFGNNLALKLTAHRCNAHTNQNADNINIC